MQRQIHALRFHRQYLDRPAEREEYDALFRKMSPVRTPYWVAPGSPPRLEHRTDFDGEAHCFRRRSQREILKGRFQGGGIAYADERDFELAAAAYRKNPEGASWEERELLDFLSREGPMNIGLIREYTGKKVKEITPLLHRLQERFLVFEDQADSEGDRAWYVMASEFPAFDLDRYPRERAQEELLLRGIRLAVAATREGLLAMYRFSLRDTQAALEHLESTGRIEKTQAGWVLREDGPALSAEPVCEPKGVLLIQRNDFLAKMEEEGLSRRYPAQKPWEPLKYILIDGAFHGAIHGRFRFGPHDVEDVVCDMPEQKEAVLEAILADPSLGASTVKRYNGAML